ncbi:MAG: ABC transporter substrate-binding protein [Xanthobacteraceae bacterium]
MYRMLLLIATLIMGVQAAYADVRIGILMPLTGAGSRYGQEQRVAVDMFLEKYGDLGGAAGKLVPIIYDTRWSGTEAISVARKLIDSDQVAVIVGPMSSSESEVALPVANRMETPIITPTAAKPGIATANRPWAFGFATTADKLDGSLVKVWLDKHSPPIKSVVILVDAKDAVSSSECTRVFPVALEKLGVKILDTITFQTGDIDFSAQVTKASGLNPDGVVLCGLYTESAHVVKEIRRQGMKQPIVAGIAVMSDRFNSLAGADANGIMSVTDFFAGNQDPTIAAWAKEYEARFKNPPTNVGALTYDTLYLTRECIRQRGVAGKDLAADRTAIRDCWAQLKDAAAPLTGANTVNADGYAVRKATIVTIEGGKMVRMQ